MCIRDSIQFATRGYSSFNQIFRLKNRGSASAPSYTTDDINGIILDVYNTGNPYPRYMNFIAKSAGDTDSNIAFWTEAVGGSPTEKLRIDSSGNVSIHSGAYGGGGTAPQLYVVGTGGRQVKIHNTNAGTSSLQITNATTGQGEDAGTQLFTQGSTGDFWIQSAFATADLVFATKPSGGSTTERLRITSGGIVQIGGVAVSQTNRSLVVGSNSEANFAIETHNDAASESANVRFYKSRGTAASPTAVALSLIHI